MIYKRFTVKYIYSLIVLILIIFFVNIIIDPYGIFETNILKNQQFNERYLKAKYLLENHNKYNSYIIGSSRVGNTNPKLLEKYMPNSRFYNYTVAAANMSDYYKTIKWMINNKFEIKNIYMQIDLDSMNIYGQDDNNLLVKNHPSISGESYIEFYLKYLFQFNLKNIENKIKYNLNLDNRIYDLKNTGMWLRKSKENYINKYPQEHIKSEMSFHKKYNRTYGINDKYDRIISDFESFVKLCKIYDINLICYITPHNHVFMDRFKLNDVVRFINNLSNIHDIWYFSGYNNITIDNLNYYEYSHYISKISYIIAKAIFTGSNDIDDLFGIKVTKYNKVDILNKIKLNIEAWDNKYND